MELKRVFFADFETDGITGRPDYPPVPCGLALRVPGQRPFYHAWGHPSKNNSSKIDANTHYLGLIREGRVPVFHFAGFDLDVGETHLGWKWPAEHHCTLLLAFLNDPRSASFSLKPLGERLCGIVPSERDELKEWIIQHVPEAKRAKSTWGAYISKAPGDLVGRYACADVTTTNAIYSYFVKSVLTDKKQRDAYHRERRLTRVLIKMERRGVPVATRRLKTDVPVFERVQRKIELKLMNTLKVAKSKRDDFKWTGETFADQLERANVIKSWIMTEPTDAHPDGQRSTSTDSLKEVGVEPKLVHELETRSLIQTSLSTFMKPWLAHGEAHDGRFYARFNQCRQDYHGGGRQIGTATGRLSMTPNLQNVVRSDKDKRAPLVRDYIVPGRLLNGVRYAVGKILLNRRDYSQQELRILAHYENGPFLRAYIANPTIDAHIAVRDLIYQLVKVLLERRTVKDINFALIYGMGVDKLALKLGIPKPEARKLFRAALSALPGVKVLKDELKQLEDNDNPLYTWGGRRYVCEKGKYVKKFDRYMTFGYKMLNVLIQGSAADCTKQAMVNYDEAGYDDDFPLILQVHDELLALSLKDDRQRAHQVMADAMADVDFKVPMLSDGKSSNVSWHQMKAVVL